VGDYFSVARHPSRMDIKRGEQFLQADFPVPDHARTKPTERPSRWSL
jgi:hypothetical protein